MPKKKLPSPEELENKGRIVRVMEGFPDSKKVDPTLAAIFLDVSEKTLARWRQGKKKDDGTETGPLGPPFAQLGVEEGVDSQNQSVKYEMGALRKYFASMTVNTTMEGAVLRGMAFSTLSDCLVEQNPFLIQTVMREVKGSMGRTAVSKSREVIAGHLFNVSEEQLRRLMSDPTIEVRNLSLDEAMKLPWADPNVRKPFHDAYVGVLQQSITKSNNQQEAAEIRIT